MLDADGLAHEVLREAEIERAARERWGDAIFEAKGRIDRKALAAIVFADPPEGPEELNYLEKLVHPRIGERLQAQIAEAASVGPGANRAAADAPTAIVLDAAVMLKAGWDRYCDEIWFVDAPRAARMTRARERGWTEEEFTRREARQESTDTKRRRANVIIDNGSSLEDVADAVRRNFERIAPIHP